MNRSMMLVSATMVVLMGSLATSQEPKPKDTPKTKESPKPKAEGKPKEDTKESPMTRIMMDPSFRPIAGERGHLTNGNSPDVYIAADYSAYLDYMQIVKAGDRRGLDLMVEEHRVSAETVGTAVLVLENHKDLASKGDVIPVEVRILQGKNKDKKVWVPALSLCRFVEVPIPLTAAQKAKAKAKERSDKAKAKQEAKQAADAEKKKESIPKEK